MVRSPGFGSIKNDFNALFKLVDTLAPKNFFLTKPFFISRRLILQQASGQHGLPLLES